MIRLAAVDAQRARHVVLRDLELPGVTRRARDVEEFLVQIGVEVLRESNGHLIGIPRGRLIDQESKPPHLLRIGDPRRAPRHLEIREPAIANVLEPRPLRRVVERLPVRGLEPVAPALVAIQHLAHRVFSGNCP